MRLYRINLMYVWLQLFVHVESASGYTRQFPVMLSLSFLTGVTCVGATGRLLALFVLFLLRRVH